MGSQHPVRLFTHSMLHAHVLSGLCVCQWSARLVLPVALLLLRGECFLPLFVCVSNVQLEVQTQQQLRRAGSSSHCCCCWSTILPLNGSSRGATGMCFCVGLACSFVRRVVCFPWVTLQVLHHEIGSMSVSCLFLVQRLSGSGVRSKAAKQQRHLLVFLIFFWSQQQTLEALCCR